MKTKKSLTMEEQHEVATQLIERKEVDNTPFVIVHSTEKGEYFGALANYRLTEIYDSYELAKKAVTKLNWDNIVRVIAIIVEQYNKQNK